MERISQERLVELQKVTPRYTTHPELPSDYVMAFAEPDPNGRCLVCGQSHTFTWGLGHGTGHCYNCQWPARLYHFVKDESGKERRVECLLQYHPDEITINQ